MEKEIKEILIRKEGYSLYSADITASDLCAIADTEIKQAIKTWIIEGKKTNIREGAMSCKQLMVHYNMKYPATLIFLDWYRENPQAALDSITHQGG